jgi:alginate O-acetyltransferase complex protein AlgI
VQAPLTIDRLFLFGFFPSVQLIGPVIQYEEIGATADVADKIKAEDLACGAGRMLVGLFKVMVLALPIQKSTTVFSSPPDSVWKTWGLLVLFAWYLYLNFAGYSDMAIGSARIFGFKLKPNFNFPYFRDSLQGFWSNWHMSLTGFCRRNIFMLMHGYRKRMQYPAILATMITIGLWHDIKWSFLVFGIYHGTGLVIERLVRNRLPEPWPMPCRIMATVTTFLFVILSYPMVMLPIDKLIAFYSSLLGL